MFINPFPPLLVITPTTDLSPSLLPPVFFLDQIPSGTLVLSLPPSSLCVCIYNNGTIICTGSSFCVISVPMDEPLLRRLGDWKLVSSSNKMLTACDIMTLTSFLFHRLCVADKQCTAPHKLSPPTDDTFSR